MTGSISPGSVTVNNDSLAYEIGGDPLTGLGTLTKDGPGSLLLTGNNSLVGATTINGGSLIAGDGGTLGELGSGPVAIAAGAELDVSRSDILDYKATAKLRILTGDGDLMISGGGTLFTYPGGGTAFAAADTWAGFSGAISVTGGSEWQSIRNGATGHGTGTITLGDATTSGHLSQIEGNWTWTNPIVVTGPDNSILNRSAGSDRTLKLQGTISGDGQLSFADPAAAIRDADIVVTTTPVVPRTAPFLDANTLAPGTFMASVDLGISWRPRSLEALDRIVTDDTAQAGSERIDNPRGYAGEIADLVTGKLQGRRTPEERTALIFAGLGLADVAVAALVQTRARQSQTGRVLPL